MTRKIIPYNPRLVPLARKLRKNMTLSEVLLWQEIKNRQLGVRFSRQIPLDEYIVDFYCKEHRLAVEIDGDSHYHDNAAAKDDLRQKGLETLGVKIIRFDDVDVKRNIKWLLNELRYWINENT